MVGTCLDPPLWSDLREAEGRREWFERGDQEKLRACAIPPAPKDTVFTQVNCQIATSHEDLSLSQIARVAPQVYLSAATALAPSALEGLALTLVNSILLKINTLISSNLFPEFHIPQSSSKLSLFAKGDQHHC